MTINIGKKIFIYENMEVAENYLQTAKADEKAASILAHQRLYNQSAYFYIQAMEKYIKNHIAKKINVLNKFFAEEIRKTMGHSLNKSLELLLKVYTGDNKILFEQMNRQLQQNVLRNVNFRILNNSLRYPIFDENHDDYTVIKLSKYDCDTLKQILDTLKNYLNDLNRVK